MTRVMPALGGFGKALLELREARRLSGREAARRAGVDATDLRDYERSRKGMTVATLERILDGYGASLRELVQALEKAQNGDNLQPRLEKDLTSRGPSVEESMDAVLDLLARWHEVEAIRARQDHLEEEVGEIQQRLRLLAQGER